MKENLERREFLKKLGMAIGAVGAVGVLSSYSVTAYAQRRGRGGGAGEELPLVEPGKGMAASVNYVNSHADVKDAKLKVARQGVEFNNQNCANCGLYRKTGEKNGKEVGACSIFAKQLVYGQAWCASWAKKA